jgi:hypothetical protein
MITHIWVIIKNGCLFQHTTDKWKSTKLLLFTVSLNVKTRGEAQTTSQVGENGTITVTTTTTTTKHSTTKKTRNF